MSTSEAQMAAFNTAGPQSSMYAVTVSTTPAYLDGADGYYDCWLAGGAAGDTIRWGYLPMPDRASPPTITAGDFTVPTPATAAQVSPVGKALDKVRGGGWAPADARPIRIEIRAGYRTVVLCSATDQLNCTQVL